MIVVLDASVVLSWVIPDERNEVTLLLLERLQEEELVAPTLLDAEVLNGILLAVRRNRVSIIEAEGSRHDAARLPIRRVAVNLGGLAHLFGLAQKHGLTAYDAVCLDLAMRSSAALATHDRRLRLAATAEGLTILT